MQSRPLAVFAWLTCCVFFSSFFGVWLLLVAWMMKRILNIKAINFELELGEVYVKDFLLYWIQKLQFHDSCELIEKNWLII